MGFQIGDKVIHCTYGLGEIISFEEKDIQGSFKNCYVVRITDMLIWVPVNTQQQTLRRPSSPEEFEKLSAILTFPGEVLPEDRVLRKNRLSEQIKDGQLASLCKVVRDLTLYKRTKKLNDQENSILERAINSLLAEWSYAQGIYPQQARQALATILGEKLPDHS